MCLALSINFNYILEKELILTALKTILEAAAGVVGIVGDKPKSSLSQIAMAKEYICEKYVQILLMFKSELGRIVTIIGWFEAIMHLSMLSPTRAGWRIFLVWNSRLAPGVGILNC